MTSAAKRDLVRSWRALDAAHAAVCESLERELQHRHGLTVSEFEVLQRLAEAPGEHSRMQELADSVHLSQSALSRLVGRLEADGLVCRNLCDADRRGIYACLTEAGRKLVAEAEPTQAEVLAATLSAP
ncbi:MAG TPA: MarR family transcriptional regulator [Gaiellaceae bacterium]|nr:MarR family transcriptional regulator [Gaiellaceae bacterium]